MENPKYPKSDWQYEVSNGSTILGYKEWVKHCVESDMYQDKLFNNVNNLLELPSLNLSSSNKRKKPRGNKEAL